MESCEPEDGFRFIWIALMPSWSPCNVLSSTLVAPVSLQGWLMCMFRPSIEAVHIFLITFNSCGACVSRGSTFSMPYIPDCPPCEVHVNCQDHWHICTVRGPSRRNSSRDRKAFQYSCLPCPTKLISIDISRIYKIQEELKGRPTSRVYVPTHNLVNTSAFVCGLIPHHYSCFNETNERRPKETSRAYM